MATESLQRWLDRRCACVHPDAHECATIRENRAPPWSDRATVWVDRGESCECPCHDPDADDEQPDDTWGRGLSP